ncbi:hypothetical protein NQ315_017429 [Exocentrus adspersus]|uniref:Peptidase aspartic putative domain-containing protein n=1 Tax=Exocentrus adspersus TaxID=1586481 RepID=A0AAV8VKK5_9CUCU|nr:hypothetical protein NQ315_017429 [Exocentrus adspersus]
MSDNSESENVEPVLPVSKLTALKKKRGYVKGGLTRFQRFLNSDAELDAINLESRFKHFLTIWDKFEEVQSEIESLDSDYNENQEVREQFEGAFFSVQAQAKRLIAQAAGNVSHVIVEVGEDTISNGQNEQVNKDVSSPPSENNQSNNTTSTSNSRNSPSGHVSHASPTESGTRGDFNINTQPNISISSHIYTYNNNNPTMPVLNSVQLPIVDFPKFDGKFSEWSYYKNTFMSVVGQVPTLSPTQKFNYLRLSLRGEALDILRNLEISAENYETAWSLLIDEYENEVVLINQHIQAIFDFPCAKDVHSLKILLHSLNTHLRALSTFKQPVETWDRLLIPIVLSKVDNRTLKQWQDKVSIKELPTLQQLKDFINEKVKKAASYQKSNAEEAKNTRSSTRSFVSNNKITCKYCSASHYINQCASFLELTPEKRFQEVKSRNLCANCLKAGHSAKACKSSTCKTCQKKHHSLLHFTNPEQSNESKAEKPADTASKVTNVNSPSINTPNTSVNFNRSNQILLCTAIIQIKTMTGAFMKCRALLDNGSQSHLITCELADTLGLKRRQIDMSVVGINNSANKIKECVDVHIRSYYNSFGADINCLIVP